MRSISWPSWSHAWRASWSAASSAASRRKRSRKRLGSRFERCSATGSRRACCCGVPWNRDRPRPGPDALVSHSLTPHDWQQLSPLLDAILDAPPERRAALLAELSGGDPVRRSELDNLVAECERAHPLLDRPATERFAALADEEPVRFPASLAERYRVAREVGRGGMATVYLAHDLKHARDVAVKVVSREVAFAL